MFIIFDIFIGAVFIIMFIVSRFSHETISSVASAAASRRCQRKTQKIECAFRELVTCAAEEQFGYKGGIGFGNYIGGNTAYVVLSDESTEQTKARVKVTITEADVFGVPREVHLKRLYKKPKKQKTWEELVAEFTERLDAEYGQMSEIYRIIENEGYARLFAWAFNNNKKMSLNQLKAFCAALHQRDLSVLDANTQTGEIRVAFAD